MLDRLFFTFISGVFLYYGWQAGKKSLPWLTKILSEAWIEAQKENF